MKLKTEEPQLEEIKEEPIEDSYLKMLKLGKDLVKRGVDLINTAMKGLSDESDD